MIDVTTRPCKTEKNMILEAGFNDLCDLLSEYIMLLVCSSSTGQNISYACIYIYILFAIFSDHCLVYLCDLY